MRLTLLTVLVLGLAACAQGERKSYAGYQMIEALPGSMDDVKYLRKLMTTVDYIDFWTEPSKVGEKVTMVVSPRHYRPLQTLLRKESVPFVEVKHTLQKDIEETFAKVDARKEKVFDIDDYNTIEDIYTWLEQTAANCPASLNCEVYSIGNSAQGRPIEVFHISKAGSGRQAYWIDATIHAREWIAPATVLKVLDNFARLGDADAIRLTDAYDWYILPVMNPDGYSYTWTDDRLWRKNRRQNSGSVCVGTDLNRNFDFRWGTDGVSHSPCSDLFCGESGGSEPETQAVSDELVRLGPSLLATVTVHSYGQMWMFPWGNTVNHAGQVCDLADDHDDMMVVADATADAIQDTHNTRWSRGNSCEVIYETSGGTDDFAKGVAGVKYAFCPELRGNSFVIPASNIEPSFQEFWNGIIAMCDSINGLRSKINA